MPSVCSPFSQCGTFPPALAPPVSPLPLLLLQLDMAVDGLSIDWRISMARARAEAGPTRVLAGNVDPMHLYGSEANIRQAVADCIAQAKVRRWGVLCVACVMV